MVFKTEQSGINKASLSRLFATLFIVAMAYWHAWRWYFNRVGATPEEAIGLLAIFIFMVIWATFTVMQRGSLYTFSLVPVALMLVIYGLSFLLPTPNIIRAAIAFTTVFMVIYRTQFGTAPPLSFWALIALSLPVVPSLQFYLGFPARYISAGLTVPLLQINGFSVTQSGTNLQWQGQLLQFDAPCSGVTMLWAGLLLTLFIALVYRFNWINTLGAMVIAVVFVLFGNVLRASSLFYVESGIINVQEPWLHEGIGVAAFALTAAGIVITLSAWQRRIT
ncbi:MAG: archaeosortase/exosortase family protein [Algicola sp.]|nr:archaeosortase/exosortase family protein [Algicola sp.]